MPTTRNTARLAASIGVLFTAAVAMAGPISPDGDPLSDREAFRDRRYGWPKPALERTRMWSDGILLPYNLDSQFLITTTPARRPAAEQDLDPDPAVIVRPPRIRVPLRPGARIEPTERYEVDARDGAVERPVDEERRLPGRLRRSVPVGADEDPFAPPPTLRRIERDVQVEREIPRIERFRPADDGTRTE